MNVSSWPSVANPSLPDRLAATLAQVRSSTDFRPEAALILGTGLGSIASHLQVEHTFAYADLPHFPVPTTDDHEGKLSPTPYASPRP
jgi:purine-nucleoside phosphorylase